jgi:hypothetical protein
LVARKTWAFGLSACGPGYDEIGRWPQRPLAN